MNSMPTPEAYDIWLREQSRSDLMNRTTLPGRIFRTGLVLTLLVVTTLIHLIVQPLYGIWGALCGFVEEVNRDLRDATEIISGIWRQ